MEFRPFPKIGRLSRPMVITEKIDGTNASVIVHDDGSISAASRNRYIMVDNDNFGFAKWVQDNAEELKRLGPGQHFGEWWGVGIQRGYGLSERRFSLFNVAKWEDPAVRPACCHVVPVLFRSPTLNSALINGVFETLGKVGSVAAPGFARPEGIVVFLSGANVLLKKTFENDEAGKEAGNPRFKPFEPRTEILVLLGGQPGKYEQY